MLESKLFRYVGILFRFKSFLPKYILSKIYYAFIHSYLNYGLIIWDATPASNLSKLCRIQSKALRVISGTGWREHAPPLYATQTILQLSKLITYSVAKFKHKFTNKKLPATFNHFFPPLRKFIHVLLEIRQNQTNILFHFFILYELNVPLNLEAQRLGTPSLMT